MFLKAADETSRDPRMLALIRQAEASLVRRRFATSAELIAGLYAALVQWLDDRQLIRSGPFDASPAPRPPWPISMPSGWPGSSTGPARCAASLYRPTPRPPSCSPISTCSPTASPCRRRAAARPPAPALPAQQRSQGRPLPWHRRGQADPLLSGVQGHSVRAGGSGGGFVLARLSFTVGTRAASTQAPAAYEIPPEVIREAIVNAVAHRDYTSNGSVQVMVFADRVEIWNPGSLPPSLSLAQLRQPHGSIPANPLLAEPLYLTQYIERLGTGTGDMIRRCREAGLSKPVFALEDGLRIGLGRPAAWAPGR